MANVPQALRYTKEHEYVNTTDEDGVVVIGITDYAQGELGDIVFIELPAVGASYEANDVFGNIEAVKAVSELFSPVAGEIVEVNDALEANPALVNSDPYDEGWMIKIRLADPAALDGLMSADEYEQLIR
jgi:glycine cleavage system H protein